MAAESWVCKVPVAFKTVLDPELLLLCQAAVNEKLEEIDAEFTWLDEIVDEAYRLFSIKSSKLKKMPKTPSLKEKGKKRQRQKLIDENELKIEEESQSYPKGAPTKLTFDSPVQESSSESEFSRPVRRCRVTSTFESEPSRPVRGCRLSSKPVHVDTNEVLSSTRKSRKPLNNQIPVSKIEVAEELASVESYNIENISSADVDVEIKTNKDDSSNVVKIKKCTSIVAAEKSGQKSPSVRDRTKAYESMLKHVIQSPVVVLQRNVLPTSASRTSHVIKVDSPIRADTGVKSSGSAKLLNDKMHRRSLRRESQKSLQCISSQTVEQSSDASNKISSEANGTRHTRTRLKLKKQNQEQNMDITECAHTETVTTLLYPDKAIDPPADLQKDEMFDNIKDGGNITQKSLHDQTDVMNETETVITEVFEIGDKGLPAKLKEFEIIHTKTTPVCVLSRLQYNPVPMDSGSDQGFNDCDEESENDNSEGCEPRNKKSKAVDNGCDINMETEETMPARTRTRAQKKDESGDTKDGAKSNKDSGVVAEAACKSDSTFTKDKISPATNTRARTRTKAQKEKESDSSELPTEGAERATRTRQRKQDQAPETSQVSQPTRTRTQTKAQIEKESSEVPTEDAERATRTRQRNQDKVPDTAHDAQPTRAIPMQTQPTSVEQFTLTRSRLRKAPGTDRLAICGSDDEILASSPVVSDAVSSLRAAKKRLAEERGISPRPKRSCIADQSSLNIQSPQLTSSPIRKKGAGLHRELDDTIASPRKSPRPFKFNSAQKKTTGFLNRTPGFGQNTSKLYSFLSNTPTCRNTSVLTSFLKRNTPPPKQNSQLLLDQKRQKLLEKDSRDMERLKKAAEFRRQKIEDQRRQREEKEQKVAEAREMKLRTEQEHKNKIHKKIEDMATVKEKMMEERSKEEREKQKYRLKKQMEADSRRKLEEEERLKKLLELEEESKMHAEFMQRKKEFEEAERRRQIAEEKRKQEERLAELEIKRQEEIARLRQVEEEKDRERERFRLEKERLFALERTEKEKMEREKREEKERKLQEELDKLKVMEKERLRLQKAKMLQQKQEEAQQNVIRQMINKHNTSLSKQPSNLNISINTSNISKGESYDMTPVKLKVVSKNKNPESYDIEDKNSDDSTDDEEAPRKKIPEWARGIPLDTAITRQNKFPPDTEAIFRTYSIEPPNLLLVFPGKVKPRYLKRTSSAIWNSTPLSKH